MYSNRYRPSPLHAHSLIHSIYHTLDPCPNLAAIGSGRSKKFHFGGPLYTSTHSTCSSPSTRYSSLSSSHHWEMLRYGWLMRCPRLSLHAGATEFVASRECMSTEALQVLVPLAPSLALCLLFLSSTQFTESISASKYPRGYAAYRSRRC